MTGFNRPCRVCGRPAVMGWPDGWYCGDDDCWADRTWGQNLSRYVGPLPETHLCGSRCYDGRCPNYKPDPELVKRALIGARAVAGRLAARVMAAAGRAPAPELRETPDALTEPRVQVADEAMDTSRAAAVKALGKSGTKRRAIFDAIVDAYRRGYGGATDLELQRLLGIPANTERPRRVELVDAGLVRDSGHRRRADGTEHAVWEPTHWGLTVAG